MAMDFIDRIQEISSRIPKQIEHIHTEEATKNAFVMPFINALGYNVFDPTEVVPEFTADVGTKKGEKVDYAIMRDGKPIVLFECKWVGADLNLAHASQLIRYFTFTEARFGVLTNGIMYHFYTDLEKPNKMDEKPFLEFDLRNVTEATVNELKKFTKPKFDLEDILATASELKYTREIRRLMGQEWTTPSEEFVRYFAKRVYNGILTPPVKERFTVFVTQAAKQFTSELVSERLKSALSQDQPPLPEEVAPTAASEEQGQEKEIHTTQEELEAYFAIKTLLREVVDTKRVTIRDTLSYCGILLDDNNRRPICRLRFNRIQKQLGIIGLDKKETRVPIDSVDDVYKHTDAIRAIAQSYLV